MRIRSWKQRLLEYLERALHVLLTAGAVTLQDYATSSSDYESSLTATILFHNGNRLGVRLKARLHNDTPLLSDYSFHYMTADEDTIFRYDNARHHHDLEHFPHHKHEGADERVIGCPQPSVGQIRDEIAAYLKDRGKP